MTSHWRLVAGWLQAVLLAAVPWVVVYQPVWVPLLLACAVVVRPVLRAVGPAEPWASAVAAASALVAVTVHGGWQVGGGWLLLALLAAVLRRMAGERRVLLARAADQVAVAGWGAAFVLRPELLAAEGGGWVAPAMLLLMSRRLLAALVRRRPAQTAVLAPPSREVRGTLSLSDVVLAGRDSLPRSIPLELELRAGESLGILCDSPDDVQALAATLTGRRPPQNPLPGDPRTSRTQSRPDGRSA